MQIRAATPSGLDKCGAHQQQQQQQEHETDFCDCRPWGGLGSQDAAVMPHTLAEHNIVMYA